MRKDDAGQGAFLCGGGCAQDEGARARESSRRSDEGWNIEFAPDARQQSTSRGGNHGETSRWRETSALHQVRCSREEKVERRTIEMND